MLAPYSLVTLLELLEIRAEAFWRLSSMVGQLLVRLETSFPPPEHVGPALRELLEIAERLQVQSAVAQIKRINETVMGKSGTASKDWLARYVHS